tara:strand:- start:53 stop:862 length:810 start_codon:yes stop_codon:yes gene_type:complete
MSYLSPPKLDKTYDRLKGKSVFVTGATSGIGEAAVRLFAAEGAKVVAAARREDKLVSLVEELRSKGLEASAVACDVNDPASVEAAVGRVKDLYGQLDMAFNNAGANAGNGPLHEMEPADFDYVMSVNLRGVFLCMKYEIAAMLEHGQGGSIVNTSSIGGLVGMANMSGYGASKWGLDGMTKCAALDYARQGIRINAIAPGSTRTEMFDAWVPTEDARVAIAAASPMNHIAHAEDPARVALFLLTDEARWTTGAIVPCEGGMSARAHTLA